MVDLMDWSYIAGFFDGEGCIYKYRNTVNGYSIRMDFSQKKSLKVLLDIQRYLKDHDIDSRILDLGPDVARRLRLGKTDGCLKLIEFMLPHLIVYREKALIALEILKAKKTHRTHIPIEELRFIRRLRDGIALPVLEIAQLTGRSVRTIRYLVYQGQVKSLAGKRRVDDLIDRLEAGHLMKRADGWLR